MTQAGPKIEMQRANRPPASEAGPHLRRVAEFPPTVRLDFPSSRLAQQAAEAVRSRTAIGSEIGGLLLGRVMPGMPTLVTVEDYECIQCDYKRGPLYKLSDGDFERFTQAISRLNRAGNAQAVVGFFRSHTRQGLALDADDMALCNAYFGEAHQIVLLVRPGLGETISQKVFVWRGEALQSVPDAVETTRALGDPTDRHLPLQRTADADSPPGPSSSDGNVPPAPLQAEQEVVKRAAVIPIVSRLGTAPHLPDQLAPESSIEPVPADDDSSLLTTPAPPPAPSVKRTEPKGVSARVGRCSVKFRLEANPIVGRHPWTPGSRGPS